MPLDTDFIRFSREIKPTKQCKISQKKLRSDQRGGGGRPLKYATVFDVFIALFQVRIFYTLPNNIEKESGAVYAMASHSPVS